MRVSFHTTEAALARIVIPRSRSRSLESMARSTTRWLSRYAPDCCKSRSTRVVLPWSTCAMIATLRRSICGFQKSKRGPAGARDADAIAAQYSHARAGCNRRSGRRVGKVNPPQGRCDRNTMSLAELRIEGLRPKRPVLDVLKRYRHLLARAVDRDMSEELQALARRQ